MQYERRTTADLRNLRMTSSVRCNDRQPREDNEGMAGSSLQMQQHAAKSIGKIITYVQVSRETLGEDHTICLMTTFSLETKLYSMIAHTVPYHQVFPHAWTDVRLLPADLPANRAMNGTPKSTRSPEIHFVYTTQHLQGSLTTSESGLATLLGVSEMQRSISSTEAIGLRQRDAFGNTCSGNDILTTTSCHGRAAYSMQFSIFAIYQCAMTIACSLSESIDSTTIRQLVSCQILRRKAMDH